MQRPMDRARRAEIRQQGQQEMHPMAARAAGIPFIHASYGFGETDSPDGVITALADLPEMIRKGIAKKHE